MKKPEPYWKKSHKCYYVNIDGTPKRLDPDEKKAHELYHEIMLNQSNKEAMAEAIGRRQATVAHILTLYMAWLESNAAEKTFDWYDMFIKRFAKYVGARLLVRDLRPFHVTKWLSKDYAGCKDNTKAGAITAVKRAFNWATDEGYLTANPIARVKKPGYVPRGDEAYISDSEWKHLLKTVRSGLDRGSEVESFVQYLTILRETGCRPQEIRAVEACHLDAENGLWKFPAKQSKGKKMPRIVPLSDTALAICKRLAKQYPAGPLFRNSDGLPWDAETVSHRFARLAAKGCRPLQAYMFRHTFATNEILKETNLITLKNIMGHKDLKMLSGIYEHVMRAKELSAVRNRHKKPTKSRGSDAA